MNRVMPFLAALAVAATFVPVQGQVLDDVNALRLTVDPAAVLIPFGGSNQVNFTITIGCGLILTNGGSASVVVQAVNASAFLNVTGTTVAFSPGQGCVSATGALTGTGNVSVAHSPDAPGYTDIVFNLTATAGSTTTGLVPATVQVGYRPGHTLTPDVQFPLEVTGPSVTFNVTVEFTGNARTMVMFEEITAETGSLSGLEPTLGQPPATEVLQITFTAPEGKWTTSNVTFYNYSHFLLENGLAGTPQLEARPVWTFVNAAPAPSESGGDDGGEDSPAPAAVLGMVLLLGLAAIRRRAA